MVRTDVMVMRFLIALTTVVGMGCAPSPASAWKSCSVNLYNRADASLVNAAADWRSLLQHQRNFARCDDGALAEGYSDAVVSLFAHRWDQFGSFVALSERHPTFRRWAIRHIDATATDDDLKRVIRNAGKCVGDVKTKNICHAVWQAATNALTEWNEFALAREGKAPDCGGPNHWPAGTAFTLLKNEGALTSDTVEFEHVTSVVVASEKIGRDLWRQVFRVTFPLISGSRVDAIVVGDASSEECSMSSAQVFIISKAL